MAAERLRAISSSAAPRLHDRLAHSWTMSNRRHILLRPPWRTLVGAAVILGLLGIAYTLWSPGERIDDGRHDLGTNGIWLGHGWLGHDTWFDLYDKDRSDFRDPARIDALRATLDEHGVTELYPHLCPCDPDGPIAPSDPEQVERFLAGMPGKHVMPWVGGVLHEHAWPDDPGWREAFVASVVELLTTHPELDGVQVNIEPCPSGHRGYLDLLEELRLAMPPDDRLGVAAYPPPMRLQPSLRVHWEEDYFREVALRADQLAVMMYDTGLRQAKPYRWLMVGWTREVLTWSGDTDVLLGLPAYDDAGVPWHDPDVENLVHALAGIHAGLSSFDDLPPNYRGIALYSEWEMEAGEWELLRSDFSER
jgi:hypothetical protein